MPKLLQINVCNNIFSTGKIVAEIGDNAISQGWESYIVFGREYRPSSSHDIKIGNTLSQCFHVLETRLFDNTGLGHSSIQATRKLIKIIKEIAPDIIHLHVMSGYYVNIRILFDYLKTIDIPIVWTLHSCWEFTGHCTHFDYEGCERWKIGCHDCPLKKEYPQSWWRDNSAGNYIKKKTLFLSLNNLHLVAVSEWLGMKVKESFFKEQNMTIIHNGVDVNSFAPRINAGDTKERFGIKESNMLIALASNWIPKKGINDYIELAKRTIGKDIAIVLVGAENFSIPNCTPNLYRLPILTDRNDLVSLYNASDIVLNLSYEESFGLTTVEGMACGTPSIVYDRTASPELVDQSTGIIVSAGNANQLVMAVDTILGKGKDFYATACRNRAVSMFDKKKSYTKYLELYNNLMSNKRSVR